MHVPAAVAWARQFTVGSAISPKQFQKRSAPNVMRCAVRGLAASTVPDLDTRLRDLLRLGIETAQRLEPHTDAIRVGSRPKTAWART